MMTSWDCGLVAKRCPTTPWCARAESEHRLAAVRAEASAAVQAAGQQVQAAQARQADIDREQQVRAGGPAMSGFLGVGFLFPNGVFDGGSGGAGHSGGGGAGGSAAIAFGSSFPTTATAAGGTGGDGG